METSTFKLEQKGNRLILSQLEGPRLDLKFQVENNRFFKAKLISQRAAELNSNSPNIYPLVNTKGEIHATVIAKRELEEVGVDIA